MRLFRLRSIGPPYTWHAVAVDAYEMVSACGVRIDRKAAVVSPVPTTKGWYVPEMCGECEEVEGANKR